MVVLLAGGTGGAKLARGLLDVVGDELTVIANTGDDIEIYGAHVSPDPDLVTFWLADRIDERGWGLRDDTFHVMDGLRELGDGVWFNLGDRDLAVCIRRSRRLAEGARLTAAIDEQRRALGVPARVLPMCDEPVRTYVENEHGWHGFQQFMIRERAARPVTGVELRGADAARLTPEVADALGAARAAAPTDTRPLPGGDLASLDAELAAAGDACGDTATARRLVYAHGSRWRDVWALAAADRTLRVPLVAGLPYLRAELAWSVRREMACTLADLLVRRTHVAFETRDAGRAAAREAAAVVAPLLDWDAARVASELAAYDAEAERIFRVTP